MKIFDYGYDPYWRDKERFDILATQGQQTDTAQEKHHEHVTILRRHFAPVCRQRVDDHSIKVVKDRNGEEIYRVGSEFMPCSKMIQLANEYRHKKPRFFR